MPRAPNSPNRVTFGPEVEALVFWGAGGQAKVLRELIGASGPPLVALFDNDESLLSPWEDVPLLYGEAGFASWKARQVDLGRIGFLIAIGGAKGNQRILLQCKLERAGLRPIVACHRTAFVADSAQIGFGCQILAHAAVAVEVVLGAACIINTSASVDHECRLGDGVHVCPGAHLAGLVVVGDRVMIGTGAVVLPRIQIGADAVIGAGAVVTRDVAEGTCIVGNPGRPTVRKESQRPSSS